MRTIRICFVLLAFVNFVFTSDVINDLECSGADDCMSVEGAECDINLGLCVCPGFTVISSTFNKCLPVSSGAGSACEEDIQCSSVMLVGGTCIDKKCKCIEGMHYHQGLCWKTRALSEDCTRDEECRAIHYPDATVCNADKKCECAEGFYQREYSDCRPITEEIGGPCAINSDCHIINSYCIVFNNTCGCVSGPSEPGATECEEPSSPSLRGHSEVIHTQQDAPVKYYDIIEKTEAIKLNILKDFGSVCTTEVDCAMTNAMCTPSGHCICKRGYYVTTIENVETCVPELGGPCTASTDCLMGNSICINDICTCKIGFGVSENRQNCLLQKNTINRVCLERGECMLFGGEADCYLNGPTTKTCKCTATTRHYEPENICWRIRGPGQPCEDQRDCYSADNVLSVSCQDGMCKCFDGYHASLDGTKCNKDAPGLGSLCVEENDCSINVANSYCNSPKCECKKGYFVQKGQCLTGIGGTCSTDECSQIPNSECKNSKCACSANFISSIAIDKCLPMTEEYGGACTEVQQCTGLLGDFATCTSDGQCMCAKKHHLAPDGKCIPSKGIGESCDQSIDCYLSGGLDNLVCRNYKCSCEYGFDLNESTGKCTNDSEILRASTVLTFIIAILVTLSSQMLKKP